MEVQRPHYRWSASRHGTYWGGGVKIFHPKTLGNGRIVAEKWHVAALTGTDILSAGRLFRLPGRPAVMAGSLIAHDYLLVAAVGIHHGEVPFRLPRFI
jgi:hypothetical protein